MPLYHTKCVLHVNGITMLARRTRPAEVSWSQWEPVDYEPAVLVSCEPAGGAGITCRWDHSRLGHPSYTSRAHWFTWILCQLCFLQLFPKQQW